MSLNYLSSKIKLVTNAVIKICEPNPKFTRNPLNQCLSHERNKALIIFHAILFLYSLEEILFKARVETSCVADMLYNSLFIVILVTSCKYLHPEAFNFSFSLLYAFYGLFMAFINQEEGVILAILRSLISPIYALVCTGSLWHALSQAAFQICCLQFLYGGKLQNACVELNPQRFSEIMIRASTKLLLMAVVITIIFYQHFKSLEKKVFIVENERENSQKQKIFLSRSLGELNSLIRSFWMSFIDLKFKYGSQAKEEHLMNLEESGDHLLGKANEIEQMIKAAKGDIEVVKLNVNILKKMKEIWEDCSKLIRKQDCRGNMRIQRDIPKTLFLDSFRLGQIVEHLIGNAVSQGRFRSLVINVSVEWIKNQETVNDKCFEPFPLNDQVDGLYEGLFKKSRQFQVLEDSLIFESRHSRALDIGSDERKGFEGKGKGVLKVIVSNTSFGEFYEVSSDKEVLDFKFEMMQRICKRLGGDIRTFSQKGQGNCTVVCLPIRPLRKKKLQAMSIDHWGDFNYKIFKHYFENVGIELIETAWNGQEGYEKYLDHVNRKDYIDIITIDLLMPVMNGWEAVRKIRELEESKKMKPSLIIVVTAECLERTRVKETMNADLFFKKPLGFAEFSIALQQYFSGEEKILC